MRWSESETEKLRMMVAQEMRAADIAAALGRTERSVDGRIRSVYPGGSGRRVGVRVAPIEDMLAAGVDERGPDECWEWTRLRSPKGYGRLMHDRRAYRAHRVAWVVANGRDVPDGQVVRHTCDNPPCCNPAHLVLGTHVQNMNDRDERDRGPQGERSGHARLTREQVVEIRSRRSTGEILRVLAADYGVGLTTIHAITSGRNWRHL